MPRRPTKITLTQYIDSRDAAAVTAAEAAGYRRTPKTSGVQAEIRGYLLSHAGKAGLITGASTPKNIQRFMNTVYSAAFEAVEQYKTTISQNHQAMNMNNNAPIGAPNEHFASPEEISAMQAVVQQVVPQLSVAQAGIVAQQALAMGADIDIDLDDLLSRFAGLGVAGGKRRRHPTKKHHIKKHHTKKHRKTRRN